MKKIIIFVVVLIFLSLLFANETDNILEINGEKIYFSLQGHINSKYIINNNQKYKDLITKFYNDKIDEIKKEHNIAVSIIYLPDSLSNDYIKIKKGNKTIKINSASFYQDTIKGFKLEPGYFKSKLRIRIALSDSMTYNRNYRDLYVISQKSSTMKWVTGNSLLKIQDKTTQERLNNIIVNYFIENRDVYAHQMDYRNFDINSLNDYELEEEINSKFDFQFFKIDKGLYLVNGKTFSGWDNQFIALVITESNEVVFKSTANFLNSFNIFNTRYYYCSDFKSGSGIKNYQIFRIKDNRFEIIFTDGSYSN